MKKYIIIWSEFDRITCEKFNQRDECEKRLTVLFNRPCTQVEYVLFGQMLTFQIVKHVDAVKIDPCC